MCGRKIWDTSLSRPDSRRIWPIDSSLSLGADFSIEKSGIIFSLLICICTLCSAETIVEQYDSDDKQPAYGDALVTGSIADARTLLPILASDSASSDICGMIFNGLLKYDKDINLIGDLAESWDIEDNGLSIVFHLRKNINWHDGHPFTAADVEFTYQKLADPDVRTSYSSNFTMVKSLQVIDEFTVKLTYKEPFSPGLSSWTMPVIPKHILQNQDINAADFARNPIGTGPYKFKSWRTQQKIELKAYKEYFEKAPYISRYITRVIPDESTLFLELQALGIDLGSLTPLQFKRQTDNKPFKANFRKFRLPSFGYVYLAYNLKHPFFKDMRVRQALNYAVDKEKIINGVLLGSGRQTTGPFAQDSWAYNKNVLPAEYSKQKALLLLKEAGWADHNNDGWLDKEGHNFEFSVITNQGNQERQLALQIIQSELKEIGINVKIKIIEWTAFISEFINKRRFEAVLLGWSLGREPDIYDIWHSSKTKEGEFNFIGYENPEVDRLLLQARRDFDIQKRSQAYHRIHEIIYNEQPYMFLYAPDSLIAVTSRIEGIRPAPIGIGYNFIDWWVPRAKQRYRTVMEQ